MAVDREMQARMEDAMRQVGAGFQRMAAEFGRASEALGRAAEQARMMRMRSRLNSADVHQLTYLSGSAPGSAMRTACDASGLVVQMGDQKPPLYQCAADSIFFLATGTDDATTCAACRRAGNMGERAS